MQAKASTSKGGGDLMSDLFNKLAMRRKGISGSKTSAEKSGSASGGSALDKISSMIPPPQNKPAESHDDDDDWK